MISRFLLLIVAACLCFCASPLQAQVIEAEICYVEDLNDDGVWDMLFVDEDGDGKIDDHIYHPEGFHFYPIWRGGIVDPVNPPESNAPSVDCESIDKWMKSGKDLLDLIDGFIKHEKKDKEQEPDPQPDRW